MLDKIFSLKAWKRKSTFLWRFYLQKISILLLKLSCKYPHESGEFVLTEFMYRSIYSHIYNIPAQHTPHENGVHIKDLDNIFLKMYVTNETTSYRARLFYTKEPDTIEWIDSLGENGVLWDIGANVGVYSLYAAKHKNIEVYAFEPSVLNFELLVRNIWLNNLTHKIVAIPAPLFSHTKCSDFLLDNPVMGGSGSCFDRNIDCFGMPMHGALKYRTLGFSGDDMVAFCGVPVPDSIKIDVDGIEDFIVSGMKNVLLNIKVRSVIVEVNDDFIEQATTVERVLKDAGFRLKSKVKTEDGDHSICNRVYVRV